MTDPVSDLSGSLMWFAATGHTLRGIFLNIGNNMEGWAL